LSKYDVDINRALVKPIYIGLAMNVFFPSVVALVVYFIESEGGKIAPAAYPNDLLLWALAGLAVMDGAVAIFFKQRRFFVPMIRSKESFAEDFYAGVTSSSILVFALCAAIAVYGVVAYFLSRTFDYLLFFILLSFIAFQIVRPRAGFLKKVLEAQEGHVEAGRFLGRP